MPDTGWEWRFVYLTRYWSRRSGAMEEGKAMEKPAMEVDINQVRLGIIQGDITLQATDAIVNAANSGLMGGGGVDGAIHRTGGSAILEECKQILSRQGRLPTGKAVITSGGNLKARFVIHTVGPVWHGGNQAEPELLTSAYRECLRVVVGNNLGSISFPSISTGVYRYPVTEAAKVALGTVAAFLKERDTSIKEVVFVLFDSVTFASYSLVLGELVKG